MIQKSGNSSKISWGHVETREIPALTKQEVKAAWLSKNELWFVTEGCLQTIELMTKNVPIHAGDTRRHCERGLECAIPRRGAMMKRARDARTAVFEVQASQRRARIFNEEALANCYNKVSALYVEEAARMGMSDHLAAQKYLSEAESDQETKKDSSFLSSLRITKSVRPSMKIGNPMRGLLRFRRSATRVT